MIREISAKEIAVSGLKAQRARMNVIANNIANAESTRTAKGGAFRRQLAVFRGGEWAPGAKASELGVRVTRVAADPSPLRMVYDPGHPDANTDGYVAYPNVSIAVEMADLVSAQRAYDANISVILSDKRMTQKALEIIQV